MPFISTSTVPNITNFRSIRIVVSLLYTFRKHYSTAVPSTKTLEVLGPNFIVTNVSYSAYLPSLKREGRKHLKKQLSTIKSTIFTLLTLQEHAATSLFYVNVLRRHTPFSCKGSRLPIHICSTQYFHYLLYD